MPRAFSEFEKDVIRSQLRLKGRALFEHTGLRKTSVEDLATAAGISKGAFYVFYNSKEELFLDILEEIEKEIQTSISESVINPKINVKKNFMNMLNELLLVWDASPLLKNLTQSDFNFLVRKIPKERVILHTKNDQEFAGRLLRRIEQQGIRVKVQSNLVGGLIKGLFFISLHREDLGQQDYQQTMNVLIELVSGYIVGE